MFELLFTKTVKLFVKVLLRCKVYFLMKKQLSTSTP